MFCPNCGTNNPDGSKFCSQCGTVFEAEAETPVVTENAQPVQTVDQIIEGIAPSNSSEGDKPTVDQIIEEIVPEKTAVLAAPEPAIPEPSVSAASMPEQPAVSLIPTMPEQPAVSSIPTMPEQPMQPQFQQPVQPQYQQPMQPQPPQQPIYGQPYPQQLAAPKPPKPPRKPLDPRQKKMLIIGGSCGAVLVAFLIVLFAAIIPHSGLKGKLRYTWTRVDSTRTVNILDLKKKRWTYGTDTYKIKDWKVNGDRLAITTTDEFGLTTDTEVFVVAFSPDGKKVYLFDAVGYDDGDRPDYVFARGNNVQSSNINDLLW